MKQRNLVKKVYEACVTHNLEALAQLRKQEFEKIIKRKSEKRNFNTRWTVVKI
jgi:hypothetical protein